MHEERSNKNIEGSTTVVPPMLCANGCGFYGSRERDNFCSSCFKKLYLDIKKEGNLITPPVSDVIASSPTTELVEVIETNEEKKPVLGPRVQNNKSRCFACKKKIGFTGCECRCGYIFCGEHRYADKHSCDFDYKSFTKAHLMVSNPVIAAQKVERL